jgi:hypothetical protein
MEAERSDNRKRGVIRVGRPCAEACATPTISKVTSTHAGVAPGAAHLIGGRRCACLLTSAVNPHHQQRGRRSLMDDPRSCRCRAGRRRIVRRRHAGAADRPRNGQSRPDRVECWHNIGAVRRLRRRLELRRDPVCCVPADWGNRPAPLLARPPFFGTKADDSVIRLGHPCAARPEAPRRRACVLLPFAVWKNSPSVAGPHDAGGGWGLPDAGEPTVHRKGWPLR